MKAVILAGGFGTRLKKIVSDRPKPMALIAGKPFLEHQIRLLREQGITDIILCVHYMSDVIKSYFGNGKRFQVKITYSDEDIPLGTAGAIKNAEKYIDDTFFVLNGDSFSKINLKKFLEFHKKNKSEFSMSLTKVNASSRYGSVVLQNNKIAQFLEKQTEGEGLINSGVYIFDHDVFKYIQKDKNISLEKEIFPKLVEEGKLYGYVYDGYFVDIGLPETYNKFKEDILSSLFLSPKNTVREAMKKIDDNGINLILVVNGEKKLLGVLTERIIKRFILGSGNLEECVENAMVTDPEVARYTDEENKITDLLLTGIMHLPIVDKNGIVKDVRFHVEDVKKEHYPAICGKSPLRISFAGGGTDLPYFFEKYGGAVVNATVDKYCYGTIIKRADSKIIINSELVDDIILDSIESIKYDGRLDLVKAIIKIMKPEFGFELYLHNDIPPGRGLGSSASLSVLVISLLNAIQGTQLNDYKIAEIAYKAEREELKIKGGWQDQYACVKGGFNFMEFGNEKTIIYPLRLKDEVINELNSRLLLCYVGKAHESGDIHKNQERTFVENEEAVIERLNKIKKMAIDVRDALLTNNLESIGKMLHESWESKRKLDKSITNNRIDELYEIGMKNGAYGGKLLGAGGGGYILFFYSPKKRNQLKKSLENAGGEVINFSFEFRGTQIWSMKNGVSF